MNTRAARPRGLPGRFAEFDRFYSSLPDEMGKRPRYLHGVGIFKGKRDDTAWVKIRIPRGAVFRGKHYPPRSSVEIKAGKLSSWSWPQLLGYRDELQGRADRGEPLEETTPPTFGEWAADWLERSRSRISAYETAEIHVRCHLLQTFGPKLLSAITPADINAWAAAQRKKLSPATVRRQFSTLRSILNDAVRSEIIKRNPCSQTERFRGDAARQRFLTGEEIQKVIAVAEQKAPWLADFVLWALHSGMRRGEILALTWDNIKSVNDGLRVAMVGKSKSGKPRMTVCTRTMCEVLDRQKKRCEDKRGPVFPVSLMTLRRRWGAARKEAGLDDITIHDLRRTHSTYAAAGGVDLRTLADRIGHSDLTMLQKHYAAVVGSAASGAADTFQNIFDDMVIMKADQKES